MNVAAWTIASVDIVELVIAVVGAEKVAVKVVVAVVVVGVVAVAGGWAIE